MQILLLKKYSNVNIFYQTEKTSEKTEIFRCNSAMLEFKFQFHFDFFHISMAKLKEPQIKRYNFCGAA